MITFHYIQTAGEAKGNGYISYPPYFPAATNSSFFSIVPSMNPLRAAHVPPPPLPPPAFIIARFFPNLSHSVRTIFSFLLISPGLDAMLFRPIPWSATATLLLADVNIFTEPVGRASARESRLVIKDCRAALALRLRELADWRLVGFEIFDSIFLTKMACFAASLCFFLGWTAEVPALVAPMVGLGSGRLVPLDVLARMEVRLFGLVGAYGVHVSWKKLRRKGMIYHSVMCCGERKKGLQQRSKQSRLPRAYVWLNFSTSHAPQLGRPPQIFLSRQRRPITTTMPSDHEENTPGALGLASKRPRSTSDAVSHARESPKTQMDVDGILSTHPSPPGGVVLGPANRSTDSSSDDDIGPTLPPAGGAKKKKRRVLPHEKLYLSALPSAARYSKSLMHRDNLAFVTMTPSSDFLITTSIDGVVKFWKKADVGTEFVKMFRAHSGEITSVSVSSDGRCFATAGVDKKIAIFDVETFGNSSHSLAMKKRGEGAELIVKSRSSNGDYTAECREGCMLGT